MTLIRMHIRAAVIGLTTLALACSDDDSATDQDKAPIGEGTASLPPLPAEITLPIVFAHGGAGSAAQYVSQAIRFAANGYPQDRIVAYDHNGAGFEVAQFLPGLDQVIDDARARFGTNQVYLVGHSRGTLLSTNYLSDPARAAKVAKYISLDGAPCPAVVPCIAPNQAMLPGQKHVEVATSKESFKMQFEFLVNQTPQVLDIVKQAGPVELRGRAVNFPENSGRDGAKLDFWEVDPATGKRSGSAPVASFDIGADGNWGPVQVSADKYYEQVLYAPGSTAFHHFYPQRFLRSSYLERLLSGPPDSPSRMNSNVSPEHTGLIVMRMREWLPSDVLEIASGGQPKQNVITADNVTRPQTMPGLNVGEPIAIYIHDDAATPKSTTLAKLPWFPDQFFQTGIDVHLPAADPPNGTVSITNLPRGDASKPQTLNVPNWPMNQHTVSVMFSDFPQ